MIAKVAGLCMLSILQLTLIEFAGAQKKEPAVSPTSKTKWNLIWSDEFNYSGLPDTSKWSYDIGSSGWGNHELQNYTNGNLENVHVHNGSLYLTARKQNHGDVLIEKSARYTSARMVSKFKGDWKYGKIEARAILPKGVGVWPAIWMLPTDWKYGGWPASGEIDIMENVGYIKDTVFGTVHTKAYNHIIHTQKGGSLFVKNSAAKFHIYAVEWTPESIAFLIDGKPYYYFPNEHKSSAEWPFDQHFHLLMNIAVGGDWGGKFGVDDRIFPATMKVDYIRVFNYDLPVKP